MSARTMCATNATIANSASASNEPTRGAARMTRVPVTGSTVEPLSGTTGLLVDEHPQPRVVAQGTSRAGAPCVMRAPAPARDHDPIQQEVEGQRAHETVHEYIEPRRREIGGNGRGAYS